MKFKINWFILLILLEIKNRKFAMDTMSTIFCVGKKTLCMQTGLCAAELKNERRTFWFGWFRFFIQQNSRQLKIFIIIFHATIKCSFFISSVILIPVDRNNDFRSWIHLQSKKRKIIYKHFRSFLITEFWLNFENQM